MESLFLLIPLSLAIVALAVWLFFRMSDTGQFDDMEGPAHSILMDDDRPGARGRPARGGAQGTERTEGADGADGAEGAEGAEAAERAEGPEGAERGAEASSRTPGKQA